MVNRFTVNGVTYTAKPFSFEMMCDLEAYGVSISNIGTMSLSLIRAYFAICADIDKEEASKEIQTHIMKGGKLDDISEAMSKEMTDSDFFRALSGNEEAREGENLAEDSTESASEKGKRGRKPSVQ